MSSPSDNVHGVTIGSVMLRTFTRFHDRVAFSWDGGHLSYAGVLDLVGRFQHIWHDNGFTKGQCVALLAGNNAEAWCAALSAQLMGMSVTWLPATGGFAEHLFQVQDAGAVAIVGDVKFAARLAEICEALDGIKLFQLGGRGELADDLLKLAEAAGAGQARDLASASDQAIIYYTGGTTGRSKGAPRSQRGLVAQCSAILMDFQLPAKPIFLASAPISHVAGLKVLPTLLRGGRVHLSERFDPEKTLATIGSEKINTALLVPTMLYSILDCPKFGDFDLSSLDLLMYGGSPMLPNRLNEGLERIGPVFFQLYGQTECYPIAMLRKEDHVSGSQHILSSCGFPASQCQVKLLDNDGFEVPLGEAGEICARAPYAMDGYWKLPAESAETMAGGWIHTGDIGRLDERGFIYIVDRKKDMIVTGGFNVFPKSVEDVMAEHPDVASVAVFGVPHDKWGEAVSAMVVLKPNASAIEETLKDHVKQRLGAVQTPKQVHIVTTLPLTPAGKIDKKAIRAPFWAGHARQVN